jgi:hypothetical protein
MHDIKIFKINFFRQLRLGFQTIFFLGIIIALISIIVWRFYYNDFLIVIFIPFVIFFLIIAYSPIKLFIQYRQYEKNRIIEFNRKNNMIKIVSHDKIILISPDDIDKIVSHEHKGGFRDPCSEFEYFDLELKDLQKIRITSMIADLHNFRGFIDNKPIIKIFKRRNYIK